MNCRLLAMVVFVVFGIWIYFGERIGVQMYTGNPIMNNNDILFRINISCHLTRKYHKYEYMG